MVLDLIHAAMESIGRRWHAAGWPMRVVYAALMIGGLAASSFVVTLIPGLADLKDLFARAPAGVQAVLLVLLVVAVVVAALVALQRDTRVAQLKDENAVLANRLAAAEDENRRHEDRFARMLDVESRAGLWQRPCRGAVPLFVSLGHRPTRFVTVLNLKGGVGKTALAGNLAACLGLGPKPRRVLLVDLDFQGTLGKATVDNVLIGTQRQHGAFVNLLLSTPEQDDTLVSRLAVPMTGVPNAKVILATDTLDTDEFQVQAEFFVDPDREPRFRFRRHLHQPAVFAAYDVVVFDCPPRVTVSVVNAAMCSDLVLIPTRLDRGSVEAVPRTIAWLKSLGPNCSAEVAGVVASHAVVRTGKMVKDDQQSYEDLRVQVRDALGRDDRTFRAFIPASPRAVPAAQGRVVGLTDDGRKLYQQVADELLQRMPG